MCPGLLASTRDCGDKRSRIASPFPTRSFIACWDQCVGELLDVVGVRDFRKQVSLHGGRIKGVEYHIASGGVIEPSPVSAIRVCKDGTIAALESASDEFADRR